MHTENFKNIKILAILFVVGFIFFMGPNSAHAATRTWTGTTNGSWSVASNWGGTAPVTGDDLVFPNGASNKSNTNDLTPNTIFNSITFSDSGYTLSGNSIILGQGLAGITDTSSSGGNEIALDIRVDATRDIIVTNSGESLTISGRIAGVGGINKEGVGTLILSGANTFGGILKINVGVVNARNSRALGTILAGTEVVGNAALELQGGIDISYEALTLRGYGVSSGGALRNISENNTFRGAITLTTGGAEIASDSGTLTLTGGINSVNGLVFDGAGDITFSTQPIVNVASLTKNGAGTLRYNFPNTYTGATYINAGTLLYGVDNAILTSQIFVTGGTLDIATYSDIVGSVTLGTTDLASGTITGTTGVLSSNGWTVYSGTISAIIAGDLAPLTKSTPGTVVLTRPNQYAGATTVSAGILEIQDSMALGEIDGITTVSTGATLQIDGDGLSVPEYITISGTGHLYAGAIRNTTGNNSLTGLVTLAAASMIEADTGTTLTFDNKGLSAVTFGLTIGGAGNVTFTNDAPIYGTSATLTKQDSGTLTMQALNNFTGATNVNYGEIVLSENGAMPLSTTMTISSGAKLTLDNTNSTSVVDRLADSLALTMNGGELNMTGSDTDDMDETIGVLTAGITNQSGHNIITVDPGSGGSTTLQFASLTRTAGASILFRGVSFGSSPAPGVSTLLFKTAPTLTGAGGAPNSTTVSIIKGAFGDNTVDGSGTDMVTYGMGNSNGLRLLNGAGFSGEYSSSLATNANVKLSASTTASTFSVNSLILDSSGAIADAGTSQTITLASGNFLNLVGGATVAGANTTIAGGSNEINIHNVGAMNISALITTTGGVTKSGAGTLTLSRANTYTGLTSVNEGTLLYGITDAISSGAVTVNNGTLDISSYSDTVGAVILQRGTITGSSGVLTGTSYSLREGTVSAIIGGSAVAVTRIATNVAPDSVVLLTRDNTYTGATTITSGILRLGASGGGTYTPLGTTAGGTTIASGGVLDLNGYTLGTAEAITSMASAGVNGGSSNTGGLVNSSSTPVSYSGDITLTAASRINADAGAMTVSSNISGNFALTFGGFSNITYSGVRSGTSTIVKDGIGVLTLSNGSSSYSGATTISMGTVKIGAASVGGTNSPLGTTAGATTITAGARLDLNGYNLGIAEPLTLNGAGYGVGDFASGALMNSSGSSVTFTGLITLGSASTIKADNGNIDLTASGTIGGNTFALTLGGTGTGSLASIVGTTTGTMNKIDTGTWTLSGQNTYTGLTTIYRGTLKLGVTGGATNTPLGTTGTGTTVASGGVLDFNGFTVGTAEALTINGRGINDGGAILGANVTFAGAIALGTDSRITNASGTFIVSGAVTGAFNLYAGGAGNTTFSTATGTAGLSLIKQGAGTLTITGTNTHTGETRVEAGTLAYAAGTTVMAATPLVMKGGVFDMATSTDTIGAVTLVDGTIQNGTLTGTAYTLESGNISAVIAGAVAVTKNTNNTVSITGADTISSTVTVNAGTLALSGSGSATSVTGFTVNLGATLKLDNSGTNVASRIGDAIVVTMNGGEFQFIGKDSTTVTETIGQFLFSTGHNIVTIDPKAGSGGTGTTLTVANNPGFNRTAGATVLFRGPNLGAAGAAGVANIIFSTAPTLTGASGAANSTTISVIKGAFGDNSITGTGTDMVTYSVGNTGLRRLNATGFSGEYSATLTTNTNVKLTADTAASTVSINSLILNGFGITNPGSAQTITLASASLSGNILMNSNTNIAGANTTIGFGALELPVLTTNTSTISAILDTAAAGSLTLSGTGNVTLSAANAYTGTTYINDATLTAGANNVISSGGVTVIGGLYDLAGNSDTVGNISLTAGAITTGAGTLTGNGSFTTATNANFASTITGNLGLGANATFTIGDGLMDNDAFISAVISGGFTFAKAGTGVLMLSGSNTYSGATTISAGTLRLGATGGGTNTPLGTTAGGTNVSTASAALDLNGYTLGTSEALTLTGNLATGALQNTSSVNVNYAGLITLAAASTIISNYGDINITNTGNITGNTFALTVGGAGNGSLASNLNTTTGTLTKNGVGAWTVSGGASTFTGLTTVSAGTLKLGSAGSGSNTPLGTSAGGVTVTSGAIFDLNGYTLATAEPIGSLSGSGIASIGAFINSSNNTISYSGAITLGSASRIANYGSGLLTLTGNIVGSTSALTVVTVGDITQSSASVWSGTTSSLIKEGSGTLILAGQNSITGAMTVSTGKLQLGASGGATNTPLGTSAGGVTVSSGAVLDLSTYNLGGASTYETLNLSGTGIKNGGALISSSSGNNNFGAMTVTTNARVINSGSGTIIFGGTITAANGVNFGIGGTGPVTLSGVYGASATSATITKWNSGILTIGAASVTTGLVRINGGTLAYGIADALATPPVTVAGGTWDLKGFSEGGTTVLGALTLIDGSIVNTGGAATITSSATYTVEKGTISAVLAGAAIAMNKNTGGTVTLSAANTFAGLTTINAGILAWGINDALSSGNLTSNGGFADIGTITDTVGTVTLISGGILGTSGTLTGTSYAMQSGIVSAKLGGSVALAKTTTRTLIMTNNNTYSGTTTITAGSIRATSSGGIGDGSGTNTLIFNGGNFQAGGNISSPSGRAVTLTSTAAIDTNNYTVTFAGTVGSASGITKYGMGTLSTSGAVTLGAALTVAHGTFDQAGSLSMTAGNVTVASSGVWSNIGTGAVTLAGTVSNSGIITLNSNNGSQCVDGANSILVRSSVNNTTRAWSGSGTFNMYNLDVDDMTGSIVSAYNSTLSGDTTWTVGVCSNTVSGTSDGTGTVKFAVNGVLSGNTATISGGIWSSSVSELNAVDQILVAWIDNVADSAESTAVAKYDGTGNMTGLVLNANVLSIGSVDNQSLSLTNLDTYDCSSDEDIMYSVISNVLNVEGQSCAGSVNNAYTGETLSTLLSNTLAVATTDTVTTEKINNAGTITATGSPTINLAGTSGTLFTNTGTFTPATSVTNLTGNGDATINSGSPTFYDLTISGTGVKSLGAGITIDTNGDLTVSAGTFDPATFLVTGSGTNTLAVGSGATLDVDASTFAGNYSAGFGTINLNSASTVNYSLAGTQTISGTPTYGNLTISGSGVKTLGGDTDVNGNLTVSAGTLQIGVVSLTVDGTTSITGTIDDDNTLGTNLFTGLVTMNTGGTWTSSGGDGYTFEGGLTVDATSTFTSGSGVYLFDTNAQTIGGAQTFTITNLTNSISTGDGLTISDADMTVGTLTQDTNAVLTFSGIVPTITTLTATASGNTVQYTSTSAQTVKGTTYRNLTKSGAGGTATLGGNTIINNAFTLSSGTLELSTFDFSANSTSSISGTLSDTSVTGYNQFSGLVTINSGGIWFTSGNPPFAFLGGLTNNSSAGFTSGTGVYSVYSNGASQTISGSQPFTITNLTNNTDADGLVLSGQYPSIGTLTQLNNALLTFSGVVPNITTLNATASGNTVQYTGSTQTIKGSGTDTSQTHSLDLESGNTQYASIADASQTGLDVTGDMTVEAWVNMESLPADGNSMIILSKHIATGNQLSYRWRIENTNDTNFISFGVSDTGSAFTSAIKPITLDTGTWYHLASTYDASAGVVEHFVNGESIGTVGSMPTSILDSTAPFKIGVTNTANNNPFDGLLKDVRVFNDIRTINEIKKDSYTAHVVNSNLKGEWNLNNNYNDGSGNNNALTASGSPAFQNTIPTTYLTIPTYNNLTINSSGTAMLGGDVDVNQNLTISGGTLSAGNYNMFIGGNYSNSGVFNAGAGLVVFNASDTGNTLSGTMTGTSKFNNLSFANGAGTWTMGANNVEVGGNLTLDSGTLTAPSTTLTISGDFVNPSGNTGNFVHNSGTVVFNTTGDSEIVGDTIFNNLTIATGGKKVKFKGGDTFTVNGLLTLTGASYNSMVMIDSLGENNSRWYINHQGTESIAYVELNNSGCDAGSTNITMGGTSKDGSNNDKDCWIFPIYSRGGGGGNAGGEASGGGTPVGGGQGQNGGGGNAGGEGAGGGENQGGGNNPGGGGGDTGFLFKNIRLLASVFDSLYSLIF